MPNPSLASIYNDPDNASLHDLQAARDAGGPGSTDYVNLAPYEHQAFARAVVNDHPIMGPLSLSVASPLYQIAKLPGIMPYSQQLGMVGPGASPASIDQLLHEYKGIGQGIYDNLSSMFNKH